MGIADEKWGQAVTGLVELTDGVRFDEDELRRWVRSRVAGYKTPKRVLHVDSIGRAPNGKADYAAATTLAKKRLGVS